VQPGEQDEGFARIDPEDHRRDEGHADIGPAGGQDLVDTGARMRLRVLHVGEPFTL
jgi:hypothetical protein